MQATLTPSLVSALLLASLASLALSSTGCVFRDDEPKSNQLDRLRILAIKSEPADLIPGETASLSALVFPREGISHRWSWCPVRSRADDGFACALDEQGLTELWKKVGQGEPMPDIGSGEFDLGTGETAQFHNGSDDLVKLLCVETVQEEIGADVAGAVCGDQRLLAALGIGVSIRLEVSVDGDTLVAVRTLTLLGGESGDADRFLQDAMDAIGDGGMGEVADGGMGEVADGGMGEVGDGGMRGRVDDDAMVPTARNSNPEFSGDIEIMEVDTEKDLGFDALLKKGQDYLLIAPIDQSQAQWWQPVQADESQPRPEVRRESLFMTWFVTLGKTIEETRHRPGGGDGHGGDKDMTLYVDGEDFDELLDNGWEIPVTPEHCDAVLYLVVRDDRDGVGWKVFDDFRVEGCSE